MLDSMLRRAPEGEHFAFEPLPHLFQNLSEKYGRRATIYPYALAETNGSSTFQFVKNDPAYSGIKKRRYDIALPEIEEIQVELRRLDELIPEDITIDFIKIDVEGAEFGVLKGAEKLLLKDKPLIVFECGLGASDYYGTDPGELFDFLNEKAGLKINTLKGYVKKKTPLDKAEFLDCYWSNKEYYYIAYSM
jgi:FkbM family methyltransferase